MRKGLILFIFGMFLISFASAWTETTFNGTSSGDIIIYNNTYECYQESVNKSNQTGIDGDCGQNYSGTYPSGFDIGYRDGDWNTKGTSSFSGGINITYTKPLSSFRDAYWKVKYGFFSGNVTNILKINDSCLRDEILLRITVSTNAFFEESFSFNCFNGTTFINLYSTNYGGGAGFYEEAIIWKIPYNITYLKVPQNTIVTHSYINLTGIDLGKYFFQRVDASNGYSTQYLGGNVIRIAEKIYIDGLTLDKLSYRMYCSGGNNACGGASLFYEILNASDNSLIQQCYVNDTSNLLGSIQELECDFTDTYIDGEVYLTAYINSSISNDIGFDCDDYSDRNTFGEAMRYLQSTSSWGSTCSGYRDFEYNATFIESPLYLENISFAIGNLKDIFDTSNGIFNHNKILNNNLISQSINNYLNDCSYINGYCYVPFYYSSETIGLLEIGNLNFNNSGILENNQTFVNNTIESSIENFKINLDYDYNIWTNIGASLVYNGTSYTVSDKTTSGTNVIFSKDITIPEVNATTNYTFYWNISLTNSTGTYYFTSTSNNQTVNPLSPINISTSCTDKALRFDLQDEENLTSFSGDIEYNFKYGIDNGTIKSIYGTLNSVTTFYLCINASQSQNYTLGYGEIQYKDSSRTPRRYYLWENQIISNNTLTNHSLRGLLDSQQTSFLITISDTNLNVYANKYVATWRWYPNLNAYQIVEIGRTDENGQSVIHIVQEDVDYRIGVYEPNGSLIKLGSPVRFLCTTAPCTFDLTVDAGDLDYSSFFDVQTSLTFNESTKIFTFIWNDPNQKTSSMRLIVTRETGTSTLTICDQTTSSYTGVITCNVSAYSGTFKAIVYRSASPAKIITSLLTSTANTIFRSKFGLFITIFLWLGILLAGLGGNPSASIIFAIIGLIPALIMGSINLVIFTGIILLGILILNMMRKANG